MLIHLAPRSKVIPLDAPHLGVVLVVDDERYIVDLLSELLEDEGYQVLRASDGQAALDVLERHVPDLVVTDVMMPRLDGVRLLAIIREHHKELPVILMSAAVTPRVDGVPFLPKPFDIDDLLALIEDKITHD
jgi:CheY-like chemotaxis protein